jgi:pyruvate dehydrogenase E2 component (dihydrolipoamide acetyltransferase)
MPSLGADMESGTLIEWLVKPGDTVHRGDVIAVVETDKGAIEIEVFENACVAELIVMPETLVSVGTVLARLSPVGTVELPPAAAPTAPRTASPAPIAPITPPPTTEQRGDAQRTRMPSLPSSRRKISPAARKHAREHGIDLERVQGSGAEGVVTVADVERAYREAEVPAQRATPDIDVQAERRATEPSQRLVTMQRAIAAAMSRSKREIPHYYLAHSIDLEPALQWMERRNAERPVAERLLYGALLIKAVARALAKSRGLNGRWRDDRFEPSAEVNVGIVIALKGGGLVAPALRSAAELGLDALMAALRDMTQRARNGRLKSSELGCATATISSLGDNGVDTVFPIIHPPQVAIVGFGAIARRPWVVDGGLHVRRVISVSLAGDHRVSDGHAGAAFLTVLERELHSPEDL